MKFKEWVKLDEVQYKGLWNRYRQQYPGVPEYVLKQIYINHISPGMKQNLSSHQTQQMPQSTPREKMDADVATAGHASGSKSPTAAYISPDSPNISSPSDLIAQKDIISGVNWNKKPQVVAVSPLSFDERTLKTMMSWRFGFSPVERVNNDAARTQKQRSLAAQRQEGSNEPIIIIDFGNGKYQLVEGFHRTASYLLQGAPPEQVQFLQSGQMDKVNFGQWKPVSINAYVGVKQNPYVSNGAIQSANTVQNVA
jgi:hypothetical protein